MSDFGGFQTRNASMFELIKRAHMLCADQLSNDIKVVAVYSGDRYPQVLPFGPTPWVCMSAPREIAHNCIPDFLFLHWKESNIDDYEELISQVAIASKIPPQSDKLFWVGANTHKNRQVLVDIASDHEHIMDCKLMDWNKKDTHVSILDHAKYSMLIDVEGVQQLRQNL